MNTTLLNIKTLLTDYDYYCDFREENVLEVSEDKESLPLCYFIFDDNYPETILMCVSVDYYNNFALAQIALLASKTCDVSISEPFYVSRRDQHTYFNDDAYKVYELETHYSNNIKDLKPISTKLN